MKLRLKSDKAEEFFTNLRIMGYDFDYCDLDGITRIYKKMKAENIKDVLVGKINTWNNVIEFYSGNTQSEFIILLMLLTQDKQYFMEYKNE